MPFKMHKNIFFSEKNVCISYLKFSDPLPKHTYFLFGLNYTAEFLYWWKVNQYWLEFNDISLRSAEVNQCDTYIFACKSVIYV